MTFLTEQIAKVEQEIDERVAELYGIKNRCQARAWHHFSDYSQPGAYFITICTQDRACLFGEVVNGEMRLNEAGRTVQEEWFRSARIRREIRLKPDEFVVMPNHIHGIVWIAVGATGRSPLQNPRGPIPRSLAAFIAGFKSAATKRINALRGTPGMHLWQRNYYEHVIRNASELDRIRHYIATNPLRWHLDRENPECIGENDESPL